MSLHVSNHQAESLVQYLCGLWFVKLISLLFALKKVLKIDCRFSRFGNPNVLLLILITLISYINSKEVKAQQTPELVVESTLVSCNSNGKLLVTVLNVDPEEIENSQFALYLSPNFNEALLSNSDGQFENLLAGNYLIRFTATRDDEPISLETNAQLDKTDESLTIALSSQSICSGGDGMITVLVTQGTAVSYELSGPVNIGPQQDPTFTNLPPGLYKVAATDACGDVISQNIQLFSPNLRINTEERIFERLLPQCGRITVGHSFSSSSIEYPVLLDFTIYAPDGSFDSDLSFLVQPENLEDGFYFSEIPFFHNESYTYDIKATDACGTIGEEKGVTVNRAIHIDEVDLRIVADMCGLRYFSIKPINAAPPYNIYFDVHPEDFDLEMANPNYPGPFEEENIFFGGPDYPIPDGPYTIRIVDACGSSSTISEPHITRITDPSPVILGSCTPGYGGIRLRSHNYFMENVTLLSAPAEAGYTVPIDLSEHISEVDPQRFYLNEIPAGDYEFHLSTSCGTEHTVTVSVEGKVIDSNEVTIEENCGTFDLRLNYVSNTPDSQRTRFGLQKFNVATGEWGHPETGNSYREGQELASSNSILLSNHNATSNLAYTGRLRVVKSSRIFRDAENMVPGESEYTFCIETLKNFEFNSAAKLESLNFYTCSDDSYDMYISADGYEPTSFSILSINGEPINIDNGTNPLFTNLAPGKYEFRVTDRCGNTNTIGVNLYGSNIPVITPSNLCEGETGQLSVPFMEQINYEWYEAENPDVILSTENTLIFQPFQPEAHKGTYMIRLFHEDPNSCINEVLEFTIDPDNLEGVAGTGLEASVCYGESVNLFDYLEPPFGTHGTWEDLAESKQLIGNLWNTEGLKPGTYEFRYRILGLCTGENETTVRLNLLDPIARPHGTNTQEFCYSDSLTIENLEIEGQSIRWYTTPTGSQPLDFEIVLENERTYYAEQVIDGCPSNERFPVLVYVYPEISGNQLSGDQHLFQLDEPDRINGEEPQGGKPPYNVKWQSSIDGSTWEDIPDATETHYTPTPLLETTHFRRIVTDQICGEHVSNVITIEIDVAPIQANEDRFGPLKGFEPNTLGILSNDTFKGNQITDLDEILYEIISITDENGQASSLVITWDGAGSLSIPAGTPHGRYTIIYEICQANIPDNCSRATVELWIGEVNLALSKDVDRERAIEGEILTYTFSVTNNSPFALDDVRLEDILPEGLMFLSADPSPTLATSWVINNLDQDERFSVSFDVMAVEAGTFVNEIRARVADYENSTTSPEVIVRAKSADMYVSKAVSLPEIYDGDEFSYEITVQNRGIDEATQVTITDQLPMGVRFISADIQASNPVLTPSFTTEGQTLIWSLEEFPAGESLHITLHVLAIDDGNWTNEVRVIADEMDPEPTNNVSTVLKTIKPLFIPNVIKPDNDGKNETFVVRASHKFEKIQLILFNRWGDLVYQSEDYKNDWAAEGLNSGTYYYLVKGNNLDGGEEKQYKGWVQVIK